MNEIPYRLMATNRCFLTSGHLQNGVSYPTVILSDVADSEVLQHEASGYKCGDDTKKGMLFENQKYQ